MDSWTRPNGMTIERVRVPLGVIGIIYESRPNVTADAGVLCLKSGNAAILRGGSDSFRSSRAIVTTGSHFLPAPFSAVPPAQGLYDPGYERDACGVAFLADLSGRPTHAIVSQALARKLWPGENPVGQTVFAGRTDRPLEPREVVGVVGDVRSVGSQQAAEEPLLYLPLRQEQVGDLMLIVRTRKSPATLAAPVRDVLRRMESPAVAILMDTAAGQVRAALMPQWFGAWLGGVLGLLAFLMAISGLYGVIAYAVARRTRELGIRIALGAEPVDALRLVLRQGVTLAAIGILLGLPVAMGVGHLAASALYGISPTDPLALAGASLLVLSVALLACWLPARRATRVNPIEALRTE